MCKVLWLFVAVITFSTPAQAFEVKGEIIIYDDPAVIRFIGNVDEKGVSQLMDRVDEEINKRHGEDFNIALLISSSGGNTPSAVAAYNYLKSLPKSVSLRTHNMATVGSPAILMYCAGKKRTSSPVANFIIERASNTINGALTAERLLEMTESAKSYDEMVRQILASCLKKSYSEVVKLHRGGATLNAKKAKSSGLVHEVRNFSVE